MVRITKEDIAYMGKPVDDELASGERPDFYAELERSANAIRNAVLAAYDRFQQDFFRLSGCYSDHRIYIAHPDLGMNHSRRHLRARLLS